MLQLNVTLINIHTSVPIFLFLSSHHHSCVPSPIAILPLLCVLFQSSTSLCPIPILPFSVSYSKPLLLCVLFIQQQEDDLWIVTRASRVEGEGFLSVEPGQMVELLDDSQKGAWFVLTIPRFKGKSKLRGL